LRAAAWCDCHCEESAERATKQSIWLDRHARWIVFRAPPCFLCVVSTLLLLTPLFLAFEVWQLVLSERYLGIKQIARGADPRALGLSEVTAFCWTSAIFIYWLWMLVLLTVPLGRVHGAALLAITLLGFTARRGSPLKWVLVILTFEGAIRVGLLLSLGGLVWREL
jgi:hypothetical protein